jgi:hypothetical protein
MPHRRSFLTATALTNFDLTAGPPTRNPQFLAGNASGAPRLMAFREV